MELLETGGYDRETYKLGRARLLAARELFHEELASQLEPLLNRELANRPQATLQEKQDIARFTNAELRSMGLAITCPKTIRACVMHVDKGYRSDEGRFQLELVGKNSSRKRTVNSLALPYLTLTPYPNAHSRTTGLKGLGKWQDSIERARKDSIKDL